MSKRLTIVILRQLHTQLSEALEVAKAELPAEAKKQYRPVFGNPVEHIPALLGIEKALDDLDRNIQILTDEGVKSGN